MLNQSDLERPALRLVDENISRSPEGRLRQCTGYHNSPNYESGSRLEL